jgi:pyruvoyl-dependent arginine decarboxylase (PvlArgDC)
MPIDAGISETERARLRSTLETAISRETEALPQIVGGHPEVIRAVITRVETVSPVLNVAAAVLLAVPLDRGGAAVEIEVLDAETQQPLASMAHAHFAPLSEFMARFSRLAPAELALNAAAVELAKLLRGKS